MREKEFRGLTIETRRRVYGYYCQIQGQHFIILSFAKILASFETKLRVEDAEYLWQEDAYRIHGMAEVIPETVDQFTGLHDWWENDLLKAPDGRIGLIKYKPERAAFVLQDSHFIMGYCMLSSLDDWQKVGNIHENPELLEKKNG